MMKRYKDVKINVDKNTKDRVYKPTLYPNISIEDSDIFIMTKFGDRLDLLAYKYYGDTTLWWVIAKANDITDGDFSLKPATELRIPGDVGKVLNDYERLNKEF